MESDSLAERRARELEAIDGCENEPISTIGTVQMFGALVGLDPTLHVITHASVNLDEHVGIGAEDVLGREVNVVFSEALMHRMRNAAGLRTITSDREFLGRHLVGSRELDVSVHAVDGAFIVELQAAEDDLGAADAFGLVRQAMAQIDLDSDVNQLLGDAVHPLRALAGFDRVMVYRFAPDGSGEVVAESRRAIVDSFMGLHYPAFDIPQAARRLYVTTPIRTISDVQAEDAVVLADGDGNGADLDLSLAVLRGTPEVHTQYLRNMGVRSTMSLPIVVEGELWGLFAFHHNEPRVLGAGLLLACEVTGKTLSVGIEKQIRRQRWETAERSVDLVAALVAQDDGSAGIGVDWDALSPQLLDVLPCDGVALLVADQVYVAGSCPPAEGVSEVHGHLVGTASLPAVEDLAVRVPDVALGLSAGAMVLDSGVGERLSIIFFRDRATQNIEWAGNPEKDIEEVADELRLHPRASFESFVESIGNRSLPWRASDVMTAEGVLSALIASMRIRNAAEAHNDRLGLLVRELNHRVRNLLALVQSLAIQTQTSADGIDDYSERLQERLALLASAHDLLTERHWESVELESLIRRAGAPFVRERFELVSLVGPPLSIDPSIASLISLLVHELFSNAARHGSLLASSGRILVEWTLDADSLHLTWTERGGPPVAPATRAGFGTVIITEAVPFELEGKTSLDFDARGVVVGVSLPRRFVDEAMPVELATEEDAKTVALSLPAHCLVVEDDFLISRETARLVEDLGGESITTVASSQQALLAIEQQLPGFALLDINLRGASSVPVAERLIELGVPFVFVTGYGADADVGDIDAPIVAKPLDRGRLRDALRIVLPSEWFE